MNAEIISIGTELLLGEIVDTNSAHIAQKLRNIGLNLYFTTTVGDNEGRITEALNLALDRADVVITTGGLGPTVDDVTRQAVAAATNRDLVFHPELLAQIAERFQRFGSRMSENNRQQAFIPAGAIPIENPVGTAPCFIVESERGVVISLPGVPREMKYLLDHAVLPYLQQRFNLTDVIKARVLRTAGIGESRVDEAIADLMTLRNPTVGLAAHTGQTDIRITAKAPDEASADRLIAEVEAQVRERLGQFIYGTDKDRIEDALIQALQARGLKVAISETGTYHKLYQRLSNAMGGPEVLAGLERFPDFKALCATLAVDPDTPPETVGPLAARRACERLNAPLSIAVIGHADQVTISVQTPGQVYHRIYRFSEQDAPVPIWASTWGMAFAWRWLRHDAPLTDL